MGPPAKRSKRAAATDNSSKGVRKGGVAKKPQRDWAQYTHIPPTTNQVAANGRQIGRNLIKWNRQYLTRLSSCPPSDNGLASSTDYVNPMAMACN